MKHDGLMGSSKKIFQMKAALLVLALVLLALKAPGQANSGRSPTHFQQRYEERTAHGPTHRGRAPHFPAGPATGCEAGRGHFRRRSHRAG